MSHELHVKPYTLCSACYDKPDVDAVIAEKDAEIAELKEENECLKIALGGANIHCENLINRVRSLNRAMYTALANWGWAEHVRYVDISDGSEAYTQAIIRWDAMSRKCRALAERFKD